MKRIREPKILEAARDEVCALRFDGCQGRIGVVWAHSNAPEDGKAMGTKADDIFGCFACHHCHDILDGRKKGPSSEYIGYRFTRAMKESWRRLWLKGVIGVLD